MQAVCDTLHDFGHATVGCNSGAEALKILGGSDFDLLLTDLVMPGMTGVELLTQALKIDSQLVGILMTGMGTVETAVQAMTAGALDYVLKPIKIKSLLPTIDRALAVRRLRLENLELRDSLAIHEMSRALAEALDADVLLCRIAEAALAQFDADETSIMLPSEDGKSFRVAAVCGSSAALAAGVHLPAEEGMHGWVAVHREPLAFNGAFEDPALAHLRPRPDVVSALSMPMITHGTLVGVLNVLSTRRHRPYTAGQISVLNIFTAASAAKIESARLTESLRTLAGVLEQRVTERTAKLEATMRNLESFSQSVSHDLRQPLAAINGFTQVLHEKHAQNLDSQGQSYLTRIRSAGQRMSQLIDDLLQLARITRSELQRRAVSLSDMAGEIIADLRRGEPHRQVQLDVDLPIEKCDERLMKVAFENLLGNAWKFTGRRELAKIEVGALQVDGETVYFVRDNGAGFDVTYADGLFDPFKRLHHESEFPGTGIGLATVQRIVELHGGRIWADAELDRGATFYFTLWPRPENEAATPSV